MKAKLSMSIETLPAWPGTRPELRQARICVSIQDNHYDISLLSNPDLTFDLNSITAMLRTFADYVEWKLAQPKEAA